MQCLCLWGVRTECMQQAGAYVWRSRGNTLSSTPPIPLGWPLATCICVISPFLSSIDRLQSFPSPKVKFRQVPIRRSKRTMAVNHRADSSGRALACGSYDGAGHVVRRDKLAIAKPPPAFNRQNGQQQRLSYQQSEHKPTHQQGSHFFCERCGWDGYIDRIPSQEKCPGCKNNVLSTRYGYRSSCQGK